MIPKIFLDTNNAIDVSVVGCGGTGSFLASHLARMMTFMPLFGLKPFNLTLWDPKEVSETNVKKQMFLPFELGQNKAVALATRLNRAYNLGIEGKPFHMSGSWSHVVFGCTDSITFRHSFQQPKDNVTWIDCGNGSDFGQIIVCNKKMGWPTFTELGMTNYDTTEASCGELRSFLEQQPSINPLVAAMAYNAFYTLVINRTIPYLQQYINLERGIMNSSRLIKQQDGTFKEQNV